MVRWHRNHKFRSRGVRSLAGAADNLLPEGDAFNRGPKERRKFRPRRYRRSEINSWGQIAFSWARGERALYTPLLAMEFVDGSLHGPEALLYHLRCPRE